MQTLFFRLGAISAGLGVALGAFGAHGLRARVTAEMLAVFETGVRYQMYHALALLIVGLAWSRAGAPGSATGAATGATTGSGTAATTARAATMVSIAGWLFVAGTMLFSGSLYLLTLTGTRWWGAVTPLGGVAFLAGWLLLIVAAFGSPRTSSR